MLKVGVIVSIDIQIHIGNSRILEELIFIHIFYFQTVNFIHSQLKRNLSLNPC